MCGMWDKSFSLIYWVTKNHIFFFVQFWIVGPPLDVTDTIKINANISAVTITAILVAFLLSISLSTFWY